MIQAILLIFTLALVGIGAFCGFRRGILKEGIRFGLWAILFIVSCFFIPSIIESIIVELKYMFTMQVTGAEYIAKGGLAIRTDNDIIRNMYLVETIISFIRSLSVPVVAIILYWVCGIVSALFYFIISIFYFRKKETKEYEKSPVFKISGLLLGVVIALFSGMLTIYPIAEVSNVVKNAQVEEILVKELDVPEDLINCYEGTPVQMIYRFTGMEWLTENVHSVLVKTAVPVKAQNIWIQFPNILQFAKVAWNTYSDISDIETSNIKLEPTVKQLLEAYFSLNIIEDENKLDLLADLKTELGKSIDNELVNDVLPLVEFQNKEQVIKDLTTCGAVFDLLKAEGILEESSFMLSKELVEPLLDKLYQLSNANEVVPKVVNLVGEVSFAGEIKELVQTEHFIANEQTKMDIIEIFDSLYWIFDTENETLSMEEQLEILENMKKLEDNTTLNQENYEKLLNYIK